VWTEIVVVVVVVVVDGGWGACMGVRRRVEVAVT